MYEANTVEWVEKAEEDSRVTMVLWQIRTY